jgi:hypothetical protein
MAIIAILTFATALPGTTSGNMWEHQYLQQSNQIQAAHLDPNVFATDGVS